MKKALQRRLATWALTAAYSSGISPVLLLLSPAAIGIRTPVALKIGGLALWCILAVWTLTRMQSAAFELRALGWLFVLAYFVVLLLAVATFFDSPKIAFVLGAPELVGGIIAVSGWIHALIFPSVLSAKKA